MNIKLLGKNLDDIRPILGNYGLDEVDSGMELIIAYGGDGALLGAERDFPGVPKLAIRDAATAPTCPEHQLEARLAAFAAKSYEIKNLIKVQATVNGKTLTALNDVFLHNADFASALRYRVKIDGATKTTSYCSINPCKTGTEKSGVPIKTTFILSSPQNRNNGNNHHLDY